MLRIFEIVVSESPTKMPNPSSCNEVHRSRSFLPSNVQNSRLRNRLDHELRNIAHWNAAHCCNRNCTEKIGLDGCRRLRQEILEASQVQRKSMLIRMRVSLLSATKISENTVAEGVCKYGIASRGIVLCTSFLVNVLNVHRQLASSVLKRPSALSSDLPGRHLDSTTSGNFDVSVVAFFADFGRRSE